ncbi:MAG TPA: hypothetical protein VF453_04360, partial [Burkholderiaceae bacterium]
MTSHVIAVCTAPGKTDLRAGRPLPRAADSPRRSSAPTVPVRPLSQPAPVADRARDAPPSRDAHPEEKKMRKTWFVTGAASHVGAELVRDALAAGHA